MQRLKIILLLSVILPHASGSSSGTSRYVRKQSRPNLLDAISKNGTYLITLRQFTGGKIERPCYIIATDNIDNACELFEKLKDLKDEFASDEITSGELTNIVDETDVRLADNGVIAVMETLRGSESPRSTGVLLPISSEERIKVQGSRKYTSHVRDVNYYESTRLESIIQSVANLLSNPENHANINLQENLVNGKLVSPIVILPSRRDQHTVVILPESFIGDGSVRETLQKGRRSKAEGYLRGSPPINVIQSVSEESDEDFIIKGEPDSRNNLTRGQENVALFVKNRGVSNDSNNDQGRVSYSYDQYVRPRDQRVLNHNNEQIYIYGSRSKQQYLNNNFLKIPHKKLPLSRPLSQQKPDPSANVRITKLSPIYRAQSLNENNFPNIPNTIELDTSSEEDVSISNVLTADKIDETKLQGEHYIRYSLLGSSEVAPNVLPGQGRSSPHAVLELSPPSRPAATYGDRSSSRYAPKQYSVPYITDPSSFNSFNTRQNRVEASVKSPSINLRHRPVHLRQNTINNFENRRNENSLDAPRGLHLNPYQSYVPSTNQQPPAAPSSGLWRSDLERYRRQGSGGPSAGPQRARRAGKSLHGGFSASHPLTLWANA